MRRQAIDAVPSDADLSGGDRKAAADQVEKRSLAGAVGTDQRVPLPSRDIHADAANDLDRAEALANVAQRDGRRGQRTTPGLAKPAASSSHTRRKREASCRSQ